MRKLLLSVTVFLFFTGALLAQKTITGKVTDDKGNPVPSASVTIKGTTTGTTTKEDGTFSLSVPNDAAVLVFSAVDLTTQEITVGSKSSITVSMISSADDLSEVVVTVPYGGSIKKSKFTGSEATVSSKSLEKLQVTNVTKALEGLAPGLITTSGNGSPGSSAGILVRGIGSFAASASPLYVLDGAPYFGDISVISVDDIESVTILKDATASALFGSRGANGVIMITTKKGKKGRSIVTATVRQGFMTRGIPEYDRVNQKDYYELQWEGLRNSFLAAGMSLADANVRASNELINNGNGTGLIYNAYNVPNDQLIDPATGKLNPGATLKWTDKWEDALYRTASRTNASINIAGGSDKNDYSLTLGYLNEEGTVQKSYYKRFNARLNINLSPLPWLNIGTTLDGAFAKQNFLTGETGGSAGSNPFFFSNTMGPIYPVYEYDPVTGAIVIDSLTGIQKFDWGGSIQDANGKEVGSNMGTRPYLGIVNPLGQLTLDDQTLQRLIANSNTYAEIKFLKNFSFKTTLIANMWDDRWNGYQNNQYGDAASNGGRSTKNSDRQFTLTMNEVLTWAKSFDRHNITAFAGHENYKYQYSYLSANKTGFAIPGLTELNNGTEIFGQPSSYEDNHRLESYFGNINYDYDQKYLLSASYRTDGSSRFHPDKRWGNFYSAGIGWRLSEENFLKNVKWINDLKFKASYGELGNEALGSGLLYYAFISYYEADGNGGYGLPNTIGNPDIKWEGNKTLNIGVDFTLFKNRLQGTIEWYKRRSSDLLFFEPLPISTGNIQRPINIGIFENTGIDVQLAYNVIRKRDFDWRVDLNLTHFKNKVIKLPALQVRNADGVVNGSFKLKEGQDMYRFWLREFAGVDAATGEALYYKDVLGTDGKPTGERVLTNNIAQASYYFQGSSLPDFTGGLTNSFRYKSFDLSILLSFGYGGLYYDGNYAAIMHSGAFGTAWHTDIFERWQQPGDITNVPKLQYGTQATQDGVSTRFLFDRSYLNIKNITLSYSLAPSIVKRLSVSGIKLFGNVDNAALISAKKGMNPQSNIGGTASSGYPPFRTITFGITLTL